jgi:hypothetical protein
MDFDRLDHLVVNPDALRNCLTVDALIPKLTFSGIDPVTFANLILFSCETTTPTIFPLLNCPTMWDHLTSLEPFGQKIPFHRQLANLSVKIMDLVRVIYTGLVGTIGKHRSQTFHRLALPSTHLVWMHLAPGRNFLDCHVATQSIKSHFRLEIASKPSSCRHLVFLR